jgi:hypothetical protein
MDRHDMLGALRLAEVALKSCSKKSTQAAALVAVQAVLKDEPPADGITTEEVLGALMWRIQHRDKVPTRILVSNEDVRAEYCRLGREFAEGVRQNEREAKAAQDAGDFRAFFMHPPGG